MIFFPTAFESFPLQLPTILSLKPSKLIPFPLEIKTLVPVFLGSLFDSFVQSNSSTVLCWKWIPDVKHCICYTYCICYIHVYWMLYVCQRFTQFDEGSSLAALILCGQFRRTDTFFVSIYFPMYLVIRPPIFFHLFPEFNLVIFFSKTHVFDAGNLFWVHKLLYSYLL